MNNKRFFFLLPAIFTVLSLLCTSRSFSQGKADTTKAKPVYKASIGPYSGGRALVGDLKRLMSLNPVLKVKDAKGLEYKVVAFEITWKKKEQSDDIKTGKPKTIFYMVGADVKSNQIPEYWRSQITAEVKAGEEIAFSQIICNDPKKKNNFKMPGSIVLTVL